MMGLSLTPAFVCRNITDILKSLIQVEEFGLQLGMAIPVALLIVLSFGYVVIYNWKFYLYGFSLSIFIYEGMMLVVVLFFVFFKLDRKLLNFERPIFENMLWFLRECLKTTLT